MPAAPHLPEIGIALVGTGFGQKVHLPALQAHPRTRIVAVYHRDLSQAQSIAQTYDIPHACDRVDRIVSLPEVQGVSLATPPFLHYEMAKTILGAGKHLFLEKPVALSIDEAIELLRLANDRQLVTTLDFEFRAVPAWQYVAELLKEGYVGQKRLIKVDWLAVSRADPHRVWNWYSQKEKGGGSLGSLGSHSFDYIAWLFGPVQRLSAHLSTAIPCRPDPGTGQSMPVDADDSCFMLLELADGTPCQVTISAVTYEGRGHWLEIYGDKGTLVLGSDNRKDYVHGFRVWGAPAGKPLSELEIPKRLAFPEVYADGRMAPVLRMIDRWVEGIDRGEALVPSLREGVYAQLLMDMTHRSHQTKAWVDVPRIPGF